MLVVGVVGIGQKLRVVLCGEDGEGVDSEIVIGDRHRAGFGETWGGCL